MERCREVLKIVYKKGFDLMLAEQAEAWGNKWEEADIRIEGDVAAQQGIRFNIFQLYQTYTGEDERLNIGPKGFTGEKYGGSTYWDTEAYCFPFYLATADQHVGAISWSIATSTCKKPSKTPQSWASLTAPPCIPW
jgi:maltose phosphorylase